MRRRTRKESKPLIIWDRLREVLKRGDPRRIFVGRFSSEKTRIIQTATTSPKRRQRVKRRQRIVMARKKRLQSTGVSAAKLVLIAVVLTLLAADVIDYLHTSPRFSITHVAVSGNMHVTARDIIAHSAMVEGESLISVSLADSVAAIKEIPWILDATIRREFPNRIFIEVTERTPVALVLSEDLFYVDAEGKVIARYEPLKNIDGPIVTAKALGSLTPGDTVNIKGFSEVLNLVQLMDTMGISKEICVSEVNIDDPSNILMIAEPSGMQIVIGTGDIKGKLWRLARVSRAINEKEHLRVANLEKIDMRFTGIVPAKFGDS